MNPTGKKVETGAESMAAPTKGPTPLSDAHEFEAGNYDSVMRWLPSKVVNASFARELERENAELLAVLEEVLDAQINYDITHETSIGEKLHAARERRLEAILEARAAIAKARGQS